MYSTKDIETPHNVLWRQKSRNLLKEAAPAWLIALEIAEGLRAADRQCAILVTELAWKNPATQGNPGGPLTN